MKSKPVDLLAIGGAHMDRTARMVHPHIAGASNPVVFTNHIGGGAFNALRNARMRGILNAAMMSVRGGDTTGQAVEQAIEDAQLQDYSGTFVDRHTPTYTAVLDMDGELITALADMALYETGFDRQVRRIEGRERIRTAKSILVDANLTQTALQKVAELASGPIYAMGISPAKAGRLKNIAAKISVLFINQRELHALTGSDDPAALFNLGFYRAVITDGANKVCVMVDGAVTSLAIPVCHDVVDVTGAGDALAGGTIAALGTADMFSADSLAQAVEFGIASAHMTLQSNGPLCHGLVNTQEFDAIYARVKTAQYQNTQ